MSTFQELTKFTFFQNKDLDHSYDYLTKVLNRETMGQYMRYLIKEGKPFTLCVTDVDNFKHINDTFGHLVGDKILQSVASMIAHTVGTKGVVGRFGGDEFMTIFEGMTEYQDMWDVCHNLNLNIAKLEVEDLEKINVTLTSGLSRFPLDADNLEDVFNTADKALYRGKTKGRNCFIIYLPEKHKDIDFKKAKDDKISSMLMLSHAYKTLTSSTNVKHVIEKTFEMSCQYFMFDHVCIETKDEMKFQTYYREDDSFDFHHIDYKRLDHALDNMGLFCVNNIEVLNGVNQSLYKDFASQNIRSTLCAKISVYGKDFGIIRADMVNKGRIWQSFEQDLILSVAHTLALILYYQDKEL